MDPIRDFFLLGFFICMKPVYLHFSSLSVVVLHVCEILPVAFWCFMFEMVSYNFFHFSSFPVDDSSYDCQEGFNASRCVSSEDTVLLILYYLILDTLFHYLLYI